MQNTTPPGRDLIFALVAVPVPARAGGLFTYSLPPGVDAECGSLVVVPFGSRVLPGVVVRTGIAPPDVPTRAILGFVEGAPVLTSERVDVALWMAASYLSAPFAALSLFLPPGWKRALSAHDTSGSSPRWDFHWPRHLDDGVLVAPAAASTPGEGGNAGSSARGRVVSALLTRGPSSIGDVALEARCAPTTVRRMVKEGLLVEVEEAPPSAPRPVGARPAITLNSAQAAAFAPIASAIERQAHQTYLLHGVTGSGKTHIYLRLIETLVRAGRQAIVLVSEIAQTPEALERYAEHFPGRVALMHSHQPSARRIEMWHGIAQGRYDVVIGPRSALFAPVPDLGLIVLDEEHEPSYKQEAPAPRYHAREVAIELGRRMKAPVVLGSATPDVGSYYLAERGAYRLITLPHRYSGPRGVGWSAGAMPGVEIVDLRDELRSGNASILSRSLQARVSGALKRDEQTILFLNRRGSATCVLCRDCGHVIKCRRCDVPMVYHKDANEVVCHQCNRRSPPPAQCPECKKRRIGFFGAGTERVETEVRRLFPSARVMRWDHDSAGSRGAHERLHRQFRNHQADVLVGTQMVAKALDFPLVTVVGVVLADVTLHLPDFRSAERTFQLLAQVAGRAGRGSAEGSVVIQTYSPDHYSVTAAAAHDYESFYREELAFRRIHSYPPFRKMARLLFTGSGEVRARYEAIQMRKRLQERMDELGIADVTILGPAPAFYSRLRGRYRWQIVLAGEGAPKLLRSVDIPLGWTVDLAPVSLL